MADNVQLSAGTADGAVIATDDIGPGVHYQIIKLAYGALDSATIVSTTNGLPVQMQGTWNITNAGTFAVQVDGDALTALQLVDDVVHSGDAALSKYAVIGAVLDDVAPGAVTENQANALRMSSRRALLVEGVASGTAIAVSNADLTTLAGAVAGTEVQVDVLTMPTTTVQATNLDIRDLTSVSDSVAAVQSGTWNVTVNAAIAAGDNNIGNVDIVTLPSGNLGQQAMAASLSVVPANNITDATYIGDIKFGEALPAGTAAIGKLLAPDIDITGHANYISKTLQYTGAQTDAIVWSPGAGKRWHIASIYAQVSADATVTFEDDLSGGDNFVWGGVFAAKSGASQFFGSEYPLASEEDAADLVLTTDAGNCIVVITGYEI